MIVYRFFSVMSSSFSHTVFTLEDYLAIDKQFYIVEHLSYSIERLKLQEDHLNIYNENLDNSVYYTLARVLNECSLVTISFKKVLVSSINSFLKVSFS